MDAFLTTIEGSIASTALLFALSLLFSATSRDFLCFFAHSTFGAAGVLSLVDRRHPSRVLATTSEALRVGSVAAAALHLCVIAWSFTAPRRAFLKLFLGLCATFPLAALGLALTDLLKLSQTRLLDTLACSFFAASYFISSALLAFGRPTTRNRAERPESAQPLHGSPTPHRPISPVPDVRFTLSTTFAALILLASSILPLAMQSLSPELHLTETILIWLGLLLLARRSRQATSTIMPPVRVAPTTFSEKTAFHAPRPSFASSISTVRAIAFTIDDHPYSTSRSPSLVDLQIEAPEAEFGQITKGRTLRPVAPIARRHSNEGHVRRPSSPLSQETFATEGHQLPRGSSVTPSLPTTPEATTLDFYSFTLPLDRTPTLVPSSPSPTLEDGFGRRRSGIPSPPATPPPTSPLPSLPAEAHIQEGRIAPGQTVKVRAGSERKIVYISPPPTARPRSSPGFVHGATPSLTEPPPLPSRPVGEGLGISV